MAMNAYERFTRGKSTIMFALCPPPRDQAGRETIPG